MNNDDLAPPAQLEILAQQVNMLSKEREALQSFIEAHDRLTRMVLDGQDFEAITVQLGNFLRTSVEVVDRYGVRLAASTFQNISDVFHRRPGAEPDSPALAYWQAYFDEARRTRQIVHLLPDPAQGLERARLLAPIMVENELLGYLILLDRRGEFSRRVQVATEHAALIYALLMMKHKSEAETEQRLQAGFLEDLLNRNYSDEAALISRGRYLGFNPAVNYMLWMVEIEIEPDYRAAGGPNERPGGAEQLQVLKQHMGGEISRVIRRCAAGSLVLARPDRVVVLTPGDRAEVRRQFGMLRPALKPLAGTIILTGGIGGEGRRAADFATAFSRAQRCLDLAGLGGWRGQLVDYADLGVYNVLLERENRQVLFDFALNHLRPLLAYDRQHRTELVETLQKYFQAATRLKETARAASIHPSALKYRLRRIQEIGNFDLDDPETAFNLQLALKIIRVQNLYQPTPDLE